MLRYFCEVAEISIYRLNFDSLWVQIVVYGFLLIYDYSLGEGFSWADYFWCTIIGIVSICEMLATNQAVLLGKAGPALGILAL